MRQVYHGRLKVYKSHHQPTGVRASCFPIFNVLFFLTALVESALRPGDAEGAYSPQDYCEANDACSEGLGSATEPGAARTLLQRGVQQIWEGQHWLKDQEDGNLGIRHSSKPLTGSLHWHEGASATPGPRGHQAPSDFSTSIFSSLSGRMPTWINSALLSAGALIIPGAGEELRDQNFRLWVFFCFAAPCVALGLVLGVRHFFGQPIFRQSLPMAVGVASCALIGLYAPVKHYSPTTAMVTVVVVMELTTLEKFIIKCSLRMVGTLAGVTAALVCACFSDLFDHHPAVITAVFFIVVAIAGTLSKKYPGISYIFVMISITFALVYSGYVQEGWATMWGRLCSVIVGAFVAFWSVLALHAVFQDVTKSLALVVVLGRAERIFALALVSMDMSFMQNEARWADAEGEEVEIEASTVQKEVREFFKLEERPSAEKLCTLGEALELRQVSMDTSAIAMWMQCQSGCQDIDLFRKMLMMSVPTLPNYTMLVERVHLFLIQAVALGHSGQVEARYWALVAPLIRKVREKIAASQSSFQVVWQRTFSEAVRETLCYPTPELHERVLEAMREVARLMASARKILRKIEEWEDTVTDDDGSCDRPLSDGAAPHLGQARTGRGHGQHGHYGSAPPDHVPRVSPLDSTTVRKHALRSSRCLNSFIHSVDLMVVELSILGMMTLKAMGIAGDQAASIYKNLLGLTGAGSSSLGTTRDAAIMEECIGDFDGDLEADD